MFDHADTDDLVIPIGSAQLSIVAQFDPAAIHEPVLLNTGVCKFSLLFAQGNATGLNSIVPGRVKDERAPAAPNIKQSVATSETEFSAEIVEFLYLRGIEVFGGGKIGAGVDHLSIQPGGVELRGMIVVIGDSLSVSVH